VERRGGHGFRDGIRLAVLFAIRAVLQRFSTEFLDNFKTTANRALVLVQRHMTLPLSQKKLLVQYYKLPRRLSLVGLEI
jgi:hypothetical protein